MRKLDVAVSDAVPGLSGVFLKIAVAISVAFARLSGVFFFRKLNVDVLDPMVWAALTSKRGRMDRRRPL